MKTKKKTVQILKVENDKLKEKLEEISNELKKVQEAMKGHRDGGHIENT